MEITEIRMTKRGRFSLYLDGEFACVVHPDVYAAAGLEVGAALSPDGLAALRRDSLYRLACEKSLRLLSQRSYSAQMLFRKLAAHVEDEEAASAAVARMTELGLIDDADYARRFAADCIGLKGYSAARTARALREKGIGRELIEEALAGRDDEPQPAIARLVLKKYRRNLEDEKGLRKTIGALQRLGYRYGDIRAVLENLAEDENYYDDCIR